VIVVSKELDCRYLYDPLPLYLLKQALHPLRPGEVIEFLSNDPASNPDMKAWSQLTGNKLLEVRSYEDHYRFYIQKN
jgi:tRNA 2-thiouridine synthesizing protein A